MSAPTCRLVRAGESYTGLQGLSYQAGLTGATSGASSICMVCLVLPPGARARTHLHRGIETAVYVIEGEAEMYFGERLAEHLRMVAGEYLYIPPEMPHLVMNRSKGECRAVVAHTSADDQDGIVLLPELDALIP